MPNTAEAGPSAENEKMPRNEEQVVESKKIPPMSKGDREKTIKQRQANRVDRLLNRRIPEFRTAVVKYLHDCQKKRDEMLPPRDLQFPTEKDERDYTTSWETIHGLCEKNSAALLFIDQFEAGFREEWKAKKKGSVEKRYLYLKPRRKEFRKMRIDHEDAVRVLFRELNVELPEVKDRDKDTTDDEADMSDMKQKVDGEEEVETVKEEAVENDEQDVKL